MVFGDTFLQFVGSAHVAVWLRVGVASCTFHCCGGNQGDERWRNLGAVVGVDDQQLCVSDGGVGSRPGLVKCTNSAVGVRSQSA